MKKKILVVFECLQNRKRLTLILFSIIFWILAIGYSLYLGNNLRYPDERWYFNDYAQNLAHRHIFSRDGVNPTAFHPPAYPLLLGLLVALGAGVVEVRIFNFLILYMTWLCLFFWLEKHSNRIASFIALLLAFTYPVLFYTAGTLYPQTLGALFFIIAILYYQQEPLMFSDAIISGIALGLAILVIPTFIFIPFFMIMFSLLRRKKVIKNTLLILIITFVTLTPWIIRNKVVFNHWALTSNFGINFLIGNSPSTTPNNGPNAAIGLRPIFLYVLEKGMDEFQANEYYIKQTLKYISNDPKHYLYLYILKVLNYFNFRNDLATSSEESFLKDLLMIITYGSLMAIMSIRLIFMRHHPLSNVELFSLLTYILSAFVTSIVFSRIRYRLPFDYLLIIFDAIAIEKLIQYLSQDKRLTHDHPSQPDLL